MVWFGATSHPIRPSVLGSELAPRSWLPATTPEPKGKGTPGLWPASSGLCLFQSNAGVVAGLLRSVVAAWPLARIAGLLSAGGIGLLRRAARSGLTAPGCPLARGRSALRCRCSGGGRLPARRPGHGPPQRRPGRSGQGSAGGLACRTVRQRVHITVNRPSTCASMPTSCRQAEDGPSSERRARAAVDRALGGGPVVAQATAQNA